MFRRLFHKRLATARLISCRGIFQATSNNTGVLTSRFLGIVTAGTVIGLGGANVLNNEVFAENEGISVNGNRIDVADGN